MEPPCFVYVGTYTSGNAPDGGAARGEGIYLFEMNPMSGELSRRAVFSSSPNPSWLALDPSGRYLYVANETKPGTVSAYRVDQTTGWLALLNAQSSEGDGPCHLSVHPSGRYVLVANYSGGTVAVLPLGSGGEVGPATDIASGGSHPHMIQADPAGRFVLSADLGLDRILVWRLDLGSGTVSPHDPPGVDLPAGSGPRHFAFHPCGRCLYSLQERACTVTVFDYDPLLGSLSPKQTIPLAAGSSTGGHASGVVVSANGRFLYAADRRSDRISQFAVEPGGTLAPLGETWVRGSYPRSLGIAPNGRHLYSCNQRGDAVACFSIDGDTGNLKFMDHQTHVRTPAAIVFVASPKYAGLSDSIFL